MFFSCIDIYVRQGTPSNNINIHENVFIFLELIVINVYHAPQLGTFIALYKSICLHHCQYMYGLYMYVTHVSKAVDSLMARII